MALVDDSSILMSIKKLLNVDPDETAFDTDIGMFINGEFMTLYQLGIGPKEGFSIHEADTRWTDFSSDSTLIEAVKTYVYLRVRLLFDPPASSIVSDAINQRINELQFRLVAQKERDWVDTSGSINYDSGVDWADEELSDYYTNKKNYVLDGENLTLFDTPKRLQDGG